MLSQKTMAIAVDSIFDAADPADMGRLLRAIVLRTATAGSPYPLRICERPTDQDEVDDLARAIDAIIEVLASEKRRVLGVKLH